MALYPWTTTEDGRVLLREDRPAPLAAPAEVDPTAAAAAAEPPAPAVPPAPAPAPAWTNPPQSELFKQRQAEYYAPDREFEDATRRDYLRAILARGSHGATDAMYRAAGMGPAEFQAPPSEAGVIAARRAALAQRFGVNKGLREDANAEQEHALKVQRTTAAQSLDSPETMAARQAAKAAEAVLRQYFPQGANLPAADWDSLTAEQIQPYLDHYNKLAGSAGALAIREAQISAANAQNTFSNTVTGRKLATEEEDREGKNRPAAGVEYTGKGTMPTAAATEVNQRETAAAQLPNAVNRVLAAQERLKSVPITDVVAKNEAREALAEAKQALVVTISSMEGNKQLSERNKRVYEGMMPTILFEGFTDPAKYRHEWETWMNAQLGRHQDWMKANAVKGGTAPKGKAAGSAPAKAAPATGGQWMLSPKGQRGWVPAAKVDAARKAGYKPDAQSNKLEH